MQPTNSYYGGSMGGQPTLQQNKPFWKRKLFVIGMGIVVLLTIILAAVVSVGTSSPDKKFADQFVTLYVEGDAEASYSFLSEDILASETSGSWKAKIEKTKGVYQSKPKHLKSETVTESLSDSPIIHTYSTPGTDGIYEFIVTVRGTGDSYVVTYFTSKLKALVDDKK